MNNRQVKNALWAAFFGWLLWIVWKRGARLQRDTRAKHKVARREQTQEKPEPGDIYLFYRPVLARDILIQAVTGSRVYHCALHAGERDGEPIVLEARPKGVIISDLKGREGVYIVVPAPEGKGEQALAWAKTQLGEKYDFFDLFVIGFEHLFKHWRLNYTPPGRYTCGELVSCAYRNVGLDLVPGERDSSIAPGDIARSLAEKKYRATSSTPTRRRSLFK